VISICFVSVLIVWLVRIFPLRNLRELGQRRLFTCELRCLKGSSIFTSHESATNLCEDGSGVEDCDRDVFLAKAWTQLRRPFAL